MKATAANFLSLIKGPKQFVIPIYQRTYSWQIAQCSKLLSDIVRISNDPTTPGHFIGSVVYFQESIHTLSDVPQLLVIDGQQRLTTVSLLIAALAEFIKHHEIDIDTTFTKLQNYYLLNVEEESTLRFKLLLTKRDKETIFNIVKGLKLPTDYSQRIWENFEYFKGQISTENAVIIYNGIQRLFVVDVALEREKDNPQLIFESLNSTGLDLSQADLIRNYVLMGQGLSAQTELYEMYWYPMESSYGNDYAATFNWFMRDYLSVKTNQIPRIDRVYEGFKNYVQSGKMATSIAAVVKDIYKFSEYYVNMVLAKEPDRELSRAFKNIAKLKVDVSYPFLLPVYDDYATGLITKDVFLGVINYVENYVFRRAICGIPTNSLNKTFATLYKSVNKENYVEGVEAAFQIMEGYKRFPADAEFEKEITVKDLYNFRSRNYLLSKLENFNRREFVNIDEYTIEHIMPQNPDLSTRWQTMLGENWKQIQETYLHTLGNLTLTAYNSELSDRPFAEKKSIQGGFDQSPIKLNTFLQRVSEWNEENIKARANQLAKMVTQIWKAPMLAAEVLDKYRPKEEKEATIYTIDSYEHLKGDMLDLYLTLRKRILNIDPSVKEEFKKYYIAFKSSTNFVDIIPQKTKLRLSLCIELNDIIDPKGACRDVSNIGRWGNGDVEAGVKTLGELDYAMELIQQAFDAQLETI
jgi:uncharacterized protein with ParB-like and HNH nuclease domain/predicted transport protein